MELVSGVTSGVVSAGDCESRSLWHAAAVCIGDVIAGNDGLINTRGQVVERRIARIDGQTMRYCVISQARRCTGRNRSTVDGVSKIGNREYIANVDVRGACKKIIARSGNSFGHSSRARLRPVVYRWCR